MATIRPQAGEQSLVLRPRTGRRIADRVWTQLADLPVWVWLGGIVAASIAVEISLGRRVQTPFVFDDELVSWGLARSFAAGGHFVMRETPTSVYGPLTRLYPALIASAFPFSPTLTRAYEVVKVINAVLMSLAAIPVFLIARRVVSRTSALIAAAFAVAIPSLAYTGLVMTENAAYPAFLLCALALVRVLERPTRGRQLVALATIAISFLIRAQAIVLVPAYVTAILLLAYLESERGHRIRALRAAWVSYRPTWLVFVLGGLGIVAALVARGLPPSALVGSYTSIGSASHLESIPRWLLYQFVDLDIYVGVVPFAACCVVLPLALRGLHGRAMRVFAVVSVSVSAWLMLVVAQLSSTVWGLGRIHERNLFYVVPLILIGFLAYLEIDTSQRRRMKLAALPIAAALPATLPFGRVVHGGIDSLALLPWNNTLVGRGTVPVVMTAFASVAALFILAPRRWAPILIFVVALNFYLVDVAAFAETREGSRTLANVRANQQWIDDAVGPKARVMAVWIPSSLVCMPATRWNIRAVGFWENEFFNRSVRRTFYVGRRLDNLAAQRLAVSPRTHELTRWDGRRFSPRYVVIGSGIKLDGDLIARDPQTRTVLYRLHGRTHVVPPRSCAAFGRLSTAP